MRPAENVKKLIKNLQDKTSPKMDERVLGDVLRALEEFEQPSALTWPKIRRTIMRSPITKLAVAAAVIAVVALGLFEFIGTGSTSGVVWAEVARKVEASRGVIYRSRGTHSGLGGGSNYSTINYASATHLRFDSYKGDQIIKTIYNDFDTKTLVLIDHNHKSYIQKTEERMERQGEWPDPKSLIQMFLSCEYRKLGQKTIDGVLCEGLETTDPTFGLGETNSNFTVDSLVARLWVSVETGYPVLLEFEVTRTAGDNEKLHVTLIADQFQWDVELEAGIFEPNIPPDYIDIWPGE